MKKLSAALILCSMLCSCGAGAQHDAQNKPPSPSMGQSEKPPAQIVAPVDPNKFAVIISGAGGEEEYSKRFASQAEKLHMILTTKLGFPEKQVFLLTESGPADPENEASPDASSASARATAQVVRSTFTQIARTAKPESQVLVVLIGHGSFDNQQAKFNLVGPDLAAKDFASLLDSLPARQIVFVNCSSSSGEFVKPLSKEGRIIMTATRSGNEQNITMFADHFITALTDPAADADKNDRTSVLEAFTYATKATADWYKQKDRLATEHALIDDNGDGKGNEEAKGGDGALAKTAYLDSKPLQQAGTDAELARLLLRRQQFEETIEKLKARKDQMKAEEYEAEFERLLIDLAKLNQEIKARQK